MRRLRTLLLAEAANPLWTSVPLLGWSHSQALAELTDAHLVTQIRNRDAIVGAGLVEGRDFTAIDSENVARLMWRVSSLLRGGEGRGWTTVTAFSALAYYRFESLVWQQFGERIRRGCYDVVHRLTPVSPTNPSPLALKCARAGVPFVLGPLNGGVPWPPQFDGARRKESEWLSYVRGAYRLLPGYRSTLQSSAAILVGSKDTMRQLPATCKSKCVYMPENAIDPARFKLRRTRRAAAPIKVVFVGRLVPYKGADMLIEAAAPLVRQGLVEIDVVGDGPQMEELRAQVEREQIGQGVRLPGWIDHRQLQDRLIQADVFGFPSIREFGGGVVLEAMAVGLPAIVVNYGGPAELVTPETGYLVPIGTRGEIVAEFRRILAQLAADPAQIDRQSAAAIRLVESKFTWQAKARQVLSVYEDVVQRRPLGEAGAQSAALEADFPRVEVAAPATASVPCSSSVSKPDLRQAGPMERRPDSFSKSNCVVPVAP